MMSRSLVFCGITLVCLATSFVPRSSPAADDLSDAYRPITQITPTSFTLQWYTQKPTETRIMLREGDVSMVAWRPADLRTDVWTGARTIDGPAGLRTYHRLRVTGLKPSHRYFYRVYDLSSNPTDAEARFGASPPWRREYAVATQAEPGRRTIIHLPVKVLLMPNVLNLESAVQPDGSLAALPPKLTEKQLKLIAHEYEVSSRFFFVNSGMRLWVDYQIVIDDRWQYWGKLPKVAADEQDWTECRSYAGKDYTSPGGGGFTIVDTQHPDKPSTRPVYEEHPYAGQVEQAFVRRYDAKTGQWGFYNSGGGTYGPDRFNEGLPGRSQFLGGGDTAWLATHEFHHQLEGLGRISFPEAENDRIVFDHPEIRRRVKEPGRPEHINAWNTAGRHGGQWDVISYWDRTLTPNQWLRVYLGDAISVVDADNDGMPDDDARLPLDEKRFSSDPTKPATDGVMNDRQKAMLATWAPAILQSSWIKPQDQLITADPHKTDSDGDGIDDGDDPYPLVPHPPFVWPIKTVVDGNAEEWKDVPLAGQFQRPATKDASALKLEFKQSYDEKEYRGLLIITGDWKQTIVSLDDEGKGLFDGIGAIEFSIKHDPKNANTLVVKPTEFGAPGLTWKTSVDDTGRRIVEFAVPNGGDSEWFWHGGGREVGSTVEITDPTGRAYSIHQPYHLFYCRMLPAHGKGD